MKKLILGLFNECFAISSFLSNFLLLSIRLWIADIFWKSGMVKISDWENTVALFRDEYQVPLLSPKLAAMFATSFELSCPILLVIGLGSRFASLPLLAMTAVIQFTYLQHEQHYYWAFLLLTIFCFGSGKISLDYFARKRFMGN